MTSCSPSSTVSRASRTRSRPRSPRRACRPASSNSCATAWTSSPTRTGSPSRRPKGHLPSARRRCGPGCARRLRGRTLGSPLSGHRPELAARLERGRAVLRLACGRASHPLHHQRHRGPERQALPRLGRHPQASQAGLVHHRLSAWRRSPSAMAQHRVLAALLVQDLRSYGSQVEDDAPKRQCRADQSGPGFGFIFQLSNVDDLTGENARGAGEALARAAGRSDRDAVRLGKVE